MGKMMTNEIDKRFYQLQDMIRQIDSLNHKCETNMKRLNEMMLELKGIIAMVRPQAMKNDWYGEEIQAMTRIRNDVRDLEDEKNLRVKKLLDNTSSEPEIPPPNTIIEQTEPPKWVVTMDCNGR